MSLSLAYCKTGIIPIFGPGWILGEGFPSSFLPTFSGDKGCAGVSRKWFDEASMEALKASEEAFVFLALCSPPLGRKGQSSRPQSG